ncbi:hypothetical protein BS646_09225 [Pseudomonas protegens]|nr:hypothetical protein BS646_09225 [Pseudomonas protegens]
MVESPACRTNASLAGGLSSFGRRLIALCGSRLADEGALAGLFASKLAPTVGRDIAVAPTVGRDIVRAL